MKSATTGNQPSRATPSATGARLEGAAGGPRRHVWSELVDHGQLCVGELLDPLAERDIQLVVAVMPDSVATAPGVVAACRERGVQVALWPMLDNADGRWASTVNAGRFCALVDDLLADLERCACLPDEIAVDLEPPFWAKARPLRGFFKIPRRRREVASATGRFADLLGRIRDLGLRSSAAVAPMLTTPGPGWQRWLGTPVDGLPFDRLSAMAYTTLFQGFSGGFLDRRDALALLWKTAIAARRTFGARASLSLGCIGTGAFGDEQTYRSPEQLAEDVAVASLAGVDDLALFNLGGALARPPLAPWLDALVGLDGIRPGHDTGSPPVIPFRAGISWSAMQCLGVVGNWMFRDRR